MTDVLVGLALAFCIAYGIYTLFKKAIDQIYKDL